MVRDSGEGEGIDSGVIHGNAILHIS